MSLKSGSYEPVASNVTVSGGLPTVGFAASTAVGGLFNVAQATVPQVDADGNETSGIRLPEITVPLATYASWNLRDASIGAPEQRVSFEGSYLPFAKTADDRRGKRDPRKAIAERYSGRQDYLTRYSQAVDALANGRWILKEDVPSLLTRGEQEWDEAMR